MKIWTIHPKYIDARRLGGLWRDALLFRKALDGKTKGYNEHQQVLWVKKEHPDPKGFINAYLMSIWEEARDRGYSFDHNRIEAFGTVDPMEVTDLQLEHEINLIQQLNGEFSDKYIENEQYILSDGIEANPMFIVVPGDIQFK